MSSHTHEQMCLNDWQGREVLCNNRVELKYGHFIGMAASNVLIVPASDDASQYMSTEQL
jgi:hypothetical protein